MESAKRVISGTWGEVWLDNEYVAECYGMQLKVSFKKEDIKRCGMMATDKKITGMDCSGTVKLYKTSSRMARKIGNSMKNGEDVRFTIISKLDDPDAYGAERVVANGVSFDDLTLADWEAGATGKVDAPFTFTDYDYLDMIPEAE